MPTRRDFLVSAAVSGLPAIITSGVAGAGPAATAASLHEDGWDQGALRICCRPSVTTAS